MAQCSESYLSGIFKHKRYSCPTHTRSEMLSPGFFNSIPVYDRLEVDDWITSPSLHNKECLVVTAKAGFQITVEVMSKKDVSSESSHITDSGFELVVFGLPI